MRMPQGAEWLIILLLILVLFGAKRLPDAARGLGRSMRILKAETKGLREEDEDQPAAPQISGSAPKAPATPDATAADSPSQPTTPSS